MAGNTGKLMKNTAAGIFCNLLNTKYFYFSRETTSPNAKKYANWNIITAFIIEGMKTRKINRLATNFHFTYFLKTARQLIPVYFRCVFHHCMVVVLQLMVPYLSSSIKINRVHGVSVLSVVFIGCHLMLSVPSRGIDTD